MWRHAANFFDPRHLPLMTRQSYRYEWSAAMLFPVSLALCQGDLVKVLADKAFSASPLVVAMLSAAPLFSNLTSLFWARLSRGRPKIRFIHRLQLAIVGAVMLVGLLPPDPRGGWMLTAIVVLCSCLASGILTVRSVVWRINYARTVRGRVTSRLSMTTTVVLIATALLAGSLLRHNPHRYVWLYPLGGLVGLIGARFFRRVRLRRESQLLNEERALAGRRPPAGPVPTGLPHDRPPRTAGLQSIRPGFWSVLRNDRRFRYYMLCQFLVGTANMMLNAVLAWMLSHDWQCNFLVSMLVLSGARHGMILLTMPMWASYMDKHHVTRLRVRQGWFWTGGITLLGIGAAMHSLAIVALGVAILGIAFGGGALAWNLGHNDFASRRLAAAYMAVHVTLAGIRGMIAPFLGMALYTGTPTISTAALAHYWPALSGLSVTIPAWSGIGYGVYFVSATLAAIGSLGYFLLDRRLYPRDGLRPPTDAEF